MLEKEYGLTVVDKSHHQEGHQASLSVVHEVAVAHPLFALAAYLSLATRLVALGHQSWSRVAEVIAEIFDDRSRLGQDQGLRGSGSLNSDDGRFAQWMDLLKLRRRQLVSTALEDLQFILQLELFQQPQNPMASRLLEPAKC